MPPPSKLAPLLKVAAVPFAEVASRGRRSELGEVALQNAQQADLRASLASMSMDGLAFALDDVMNNTSLTLLFTFGGHSLLFTGIAGTETGGGGWTIRTRRVSLGASVQISHHGSFNGTPA